MSACGVRFGLTRVACAEASCCPEISRIERMGRHKWVCKRLGRFGPRPGLLTRLKLALPLTCRAGKLETQLKNRIAARVQIPAPASPLSQVPGGLAENQSNRSCETRGFRVWNLEAIIARKWKYGMCAVHGQFYGGRVGFRRADRLGGHSLPHNSVGCTLRRRISLLSRLRTWGAPDQKWGG